MIPFQFSEDYDESLWMLSELIKNTTSNTLLPLFVDTTNNRVLVGSITASGTGNQFQVFGGDIACIGTGTANGYVFPDGTKQTTASSPIWSLIFGSQT